jgi:hypothetical protein
MCNEYNGWSNYQTWVFNLWCDGLWDTNAEELYDSYDNDFDAIRALEMLIKEYIEEFRIDHDHSSSVWSDLLGYAIGHVDCFEIAEHYIDDIRSYRDVDVREKDWSIF